jgi:hypothetical protein
MAYTTWGKNRGCCCHMHRTLAAAKKCLEDDKMLFRRNREKSDREIREVKSIDELREYDIDDGPGVPVEEAE